MTSRTEILKRHFGTEDTIEAMCYPSRPLTPPPLEQLVKMPIPYESASHPPLPSVDEIKRVGGSKRVCTIGECLIKRNCRNVFFQEAENLLFLEDYPQFPTPKLYAAFSEDGMNYIIMERIKGEQLYDLWETFTPKKQEQIMVRLLEHLQALRSIPSQGYYGRVHHQGFNPGYPLVRLNEKEVLGPYDSYEEFVSALSRATWLRRAYACMLPTFLEEEIAAINEHEADLFRTTSARPVLTHVDPTFRNIIVRPGDGEDDWELIMVDMEGLAWLPAWLQPLYCVERSLWDGERKPFFMEAMARIFGESFEEDIERYDKLEKWISYTL